MLDFSHVIDLPLIWGGLIALSIFLYVVLDGFDLGVGILFPFAPSHNCRHKMISSIAPFWDGNETWLVMGGGGILAAFPLAYSILMPALYIPLMVMFAALIFRGVAFEFRFKAHSPFGKSLWDSAFHGGSLLAAFSQGVMLGTFVQGMRVVDQAFAGGPFDWLTPFSLMTGVAVIFGYALLGSNWLILKTEGKTQSWARKCSLYLSVYVVVFMGIVSMWMPFLHPKVQQLWFTIPNIFYLSPVPIIVATLFIWHIRAISNGSEAKPFFLTIGLFVMNFFGLAISLWPWIVPYAVNLREAAAAGPSQSLLLVGTVPLLLMILSYAGYSYYVFRGKVTDKVLYNH